MDSEFAISRDLNPQFPLSGFQIASRPSHQTASPLLSASNNTPNHFIYDCYNCYGRVNQFLDVSSSCDHRPVSFVPFWEQLRSEISDDFNRFLSFPSAPQHPPALTMVKTPPGPGVYTATYSNVCALSWWSGWLANGPRFPFTSSNSVKLSKNMVSSFILSFRMHADSCYQLCDVVMMIGLMRHIS
jgi:hypothetical protein